MKSLSFLATGLFFVTFSLYALNWPDFGAMFGENAAADVSNTQPVLNFNVRMRVLDKQINTVTSYDLKPNVAQAHGPLMIEAKGCVMNHENVTGQDVAWLTVTKGKDQEVILFDGWMFNTFPEVSTLEDARFDIMVEKCKILPPVQTPLTSQATSITEVILP